MNSMIMNYLCWSLALKRTHIQLFMCLIAVFLFLYFSEAPYCVVYIFPLFIVVRPPSNRNFTLTRLAKPDTFALSCFLASFLLCLFRISLVKTSFNIPPSSATHTHSLSCGTYRGGRWLTPKVSQSWKSNLASEPKTSFASWITLWYRIRSSNGMYAKMGTWSMTWRSPLSPSRKYMNVSNNFEVRTLLQKLIARVCSS